MKNIMLVTALTALTLPSANAFTVIDNETFSYTVAGEFEIQLKQGFTEADDIDVFFDDSEFKNRITYKLNNDNAVFGHLNFDPRNDHSAENFYVGAKLGNSKLLVGRSDNAADSFGVEGGRLDPAGGGDAFSVTSGSDLIMFESKVGPASFKLSHDLAVGDGNETDTALFVSSKFGSIGVGFAYQTYEAASSAAVEAVAPSATNLQVLAVPAVVGEKADVWGVQGSIGMGAFTLAADYSDKDSNNNANDTTVANLLGAYKRGKNIFWLGLTEREVGATDTTGWYTGVNHRLRRNVTVFAEAADDDAPGNSTAFTTGVRLKF